jgi:uncharacterized protein DUF4136
MKTTRRLLIGLSITMLLPAAAMAQKVAYDYRHNVNFRSFKTFAFKDAPREVTQTELTTTYDSPLVVERTRQAIANQLVARGMREDNEHPDAYVIPRRTFAVEQVLYGPSGWGPYGWGWYGWGWGYGGPWYTEDIVKGTLVIDLVDADTGALMWRGLREKTVHPHKDPDDRTEDIYENVAKIFRKFPTQGPGPVGTSGHDSPEPR